MVVSFIKKQLEGLKSDEEIIHLLKLANPDLTERRINSLLETAKQHANIPVLDDKTVTTIRNAAKDGDHTVEAMIRALPNASMEERMQAKNILYAERNEELFPLINPTILNKTVSRENGKLQIKNVNSVMPNIRISGSRAEPQSVAMAIKHFEKIRTTRSHRAGGSIGSMNSLNPYLIFARPVVHPPKWTQSFNDYQQRLQNNQFLASMTDSHHTSQSFKFYKSGGSLPSFASGKWVNPSLQRSAQQSVLKLSQMRSVAKLQQLRKQAQYKQESHAALQQRISESTQRLMAMRRSTQSRMNAPRPNYDNMFNPMVDLMSRYPSGGMKRAFRAFRSIDSNFSMMDDVSLMSQAFNTIFGSYKGREFSRNNHPALIPNVILETDNKSYMGFISRMFDDSGYQVSRATIEHNVNHVYSFVDGFVRNSIPPSVRRTHSSQHMLRLISDILAPSIPSNQSGRLQILDKNSVDAEKLLYHGFQVHPKHNSVLIKDFSGSGVIPTISLRSSPTCSMAALPSNLDVDTVRKMLEPHTIGDTRERGFRLVHFKPGNEVDHNILKYIRDVSRAVEQEKNNPSLNEMEQTGSSFAFDNVNVILNHLLNNNNKMGRYGMVIALRDNNLELMSSLRYTNDREVNPSSTYVNIFGTRGTIRGKGIGSQVFVEAMKHAHDLGVTDFSLCPLSYRQTMRFYRRHGMDRYNHFDLALHVPRLLKEQEELRGVSIDRQLAGIRRNSKRPESIINSINRTVLETLKTRFSHAQGGLIPSFMDGGDPYQKIREDAVNRLKLQRIRWESGLKLRDLRNISELEYFSKDKDYYTLWRGATEHDPSIISDKRSTGRWFTPDVNMAIKFSGNLKNLDELIGIGSLFRLDIPKSELSIDELRSWKPIFSKRFGNVPLDEFVLSPEYASKAEFYGKGPFNFRNYMPRRYRQKNNQYRRELGGLIPSFMDGGDPYQKIREDAIDNIRSLKMNYSMNKERALHYYKGTYYDAINRFLETGDMNVPPYGNRVLKSIQLKGAIPYLDQATSEHTTPSNILYKGLSKYWMSFLQDKNVGDIVTFPGFLSTTTDMITAMKHARSELAYIHVNKDTKGYQYPGSLEPEFLMQRGQSFQIKDILMNNDKPHYILKHLIEQKALGGSLPSFESGGPQSIYNMNDASMLTSLLSPDQVDHSAKVMAYASHIWSMINGSDEGHIMLQNAASLHDIGKIIDPKSHGKLAGKFGSLLGIDKISKFLINNHSGTRQPSLKGFKKSQRSDIRKMLGVLRLADVSARVGTLPLSMKNGSLKLGDIRELDINKHRLKRIKSSIKMINRMAGGYTPYKGDSYIQELQHRIDSSYVPHSIPTLQELANNISPVERLRHQLMLSTVPRRMAGGSIQSFFDGGLTALVSPEFLSGAWNSIQMGIGAMGSLGVGALGYEYIQDIRRNQFFERFGSGDLTSEGVARLQKLLNLKQFQGLQNDAYGYIVNQNPFMDANIDRLSIKLNKITLWDKIKRRLGRASGGSIQSSLDKHFSYNKINGPEKDLQMFYVRVLDRIINRDDKYKYLNRALGGSLSGGSRGIPALVSAKEAYLSPKMAGLLGSRKLDILRSMADDNTLMDDIPELRKLFGGVPSINGAGVFVGGSGNPTADDIFTYLEPGSYILDYQTLEAMRKLDPRSVKFSGAISGIPIRRATGGVIGFAAGGFGDRVRAFASNFYNEFKYPYQAEQTKIGSSVRLQTAGYGTFDNTGIFSIDPRVNAQNQAAIDRYQTELENWAVNIFSHLKPEDAKKRVSANIQEQTKNVVKGSGANAVNVEETFKIIRPEVIFDSKDLEKIGKTSENIVESFKKMTDNAFRDPNNSNKFFKTLNLGLIETEKHVKNVALEFTALGKFSSHMKDFSFRLASVSMAAMGVNFSTMAVFQSITSGISQISAPFNDLESLMQNIGYLKAFGDAANVPNGAIQSLTSNTEGLVDTWKKIGGMTAYLQLSFASLGEALFKNDDMMEAFTNGMEEVFVTLRDPQTIRTIADLFTSMSKSLPVLADVVKGVAAALKLVADQPMIMQIMMYSTIFSMLLQPLFSLGSALLTFVGIGTGFINWSRGAVIAIKSLNIAFLGLNTTLVASLAYLALIALAIEGVARAYEFFTGSKLTFKPSNFIMGALRFASGGDDYVEGAGTTTNDKIPYMLSRGERVIPAELNARHYAEYEALETAATGEDYVGGSPLLNLTDYRYYEGIKTVTSIDTMKANQDTADTLTAARDGNAIRVIVKNANEIGGRHEEQQNEIQAPFSGGTPQLERIINPAQGVKIFDILGKLKPDLKLDWKPDLKFDLGKLDFKFDLGKIIADLFKKGGEIKPDEKIDTKSEPKSTLDWYKSFIDQIKSARGSASDDDWKPNERYFNTEDLKPPKSSKTKGGIFDTFKKFIPDSLKGFAAPEFARGDITKGNVLKSIIADKGPLKTGTGMLGYANPLDIFSVLNILNAGRFGTGATVAETVNQTIGGAITGLGVAGSLVGGGALKAAGFSKIGAAIALPGQVISKAALPLAAATPFLIGAEGAMANRRFLAGESIENIKNTPFDELSSAEKFATVLTGGIGTSATANGLKVLVEMHGEEAARQSLIATQTSIDSIANSNLIPGLNVLNRGLSAVGGPSIGEIGVGGAMTLVGLPESIIDFAHAVAGLPAWFESLIKPEDQGDQATGSIAQTYNEMNKRIDTSGMQYVGKTDEVVAWMNQQIAAQQQPQLNNISFVINAQPDIADQVYGIVDNALRSNGFYDGQRV